MSKKVPIQVAIQGGAGRITDLMAAAEALQQLELEPDAGFYVTRLSGTSAGAIVAALYTMAWWDGEDQKLKRNLLQIRTDLEGRYTPPKTFHKLFPKVSVHGGSGRDLVIGPTARRIST